MRETDRKVSPNVKILLVDDDVRFRTMLRDILAASIPHLDRIVECDRAEEAIASYRRHRSDLVIMDVALGGMDGLEATREIIRGDGDAQIVVFSQYDDPLYRKAAREAGARCYIVKERIDELIDTISCFTLSTRKDNEHERT